jgi:hypothetical protein
MVSPLRGTKRGSNPRVPKKGLDFFALARNDGGGRDRRDTDVNKE